MAAAADGTLRTARFKIAKGMAARQAQPAVACGKSLAVKHWSGESLAVKHWYGESLGLPVAGDVILWQDRWIGA